MEKLRTRPILEELTTLRRQIIDDGGDWYRIFTNTIGPQLLQELLNREVNQLTQQGESGEKDTGEVR